MKLSQVVRKLDLALSSLRFTESQDNFVTLNSISVTGRTNMPDVESHAVGVYIHAIFYRVRKQILREGKYGVTSITLSSGMILLRLKKYGDNVTKQSVLYDGVEDTYTCECQCYPIKGIPCRYIFACMKHMGVTKILVSLIWKHWT